MKAADQIQRSNDSPNSHTGKQFLFLEEGNPSGQGGLSVKKTILFSTSLLYNSSSLAYNYDMTYDSIGHLTSYASWTYTWAESRKLVKQVRNLGIYHKPIQ